MQSESENVLFKKWSEKRDPPHPTNSQTILSSEIFECFLACIGIRHLPCAARWQVTYTILLGLGAARSAAHLESHYTAPSRAPAREFLMLPELL